MVHVGDGTVLELYAWRQWPSLASPVGTSSTEDDLEDEGFSLSSNLDEEPGGLVNRIEIGVRRYNLYDSGEDAIRDLGF
jgi:hypothetical protein